MEKAEDIVLIRSYWTIVVILFARLGKLKDPKAATVHTIREIHPSELSISFWGLMNWCTLWLFNIAMV